MKVGTPPWPKRPKSSAPIVGSTSTRFEVPSSRASIGTTLATRLGVFTVGGVLSPRVTTGAGALWASASPLARRRIPSTSWSETSGLNDLRVSWSRTSLGMMLCLVPPWIEPTVTTAGWIGLISRLTIVWRSSTSRAARAIGSTVFWGIAPWPPFPFTRTSTEVELAIAGPLV